MPNIKGRPLHTRSLTVIVSRESDSCWHARGDVIDLRKHSFVPLVDDIQPAGVIHMMSIDFDFDPDSLRIDGIQIEQPFVAIESSEATGGDCCRDPAPRLLELNGETLGPAFIKRLSGQFGGPLGCSHLLTLFQLMSSTIPRAVGLEQSRTRREGRKQPDGTRFFRRSLFVDGHEGDGRTIEVALQLTDTHTRPIDPRERSITRLEISHEVKAAVGIDRKRFKIQSINVRERKRSFETLSAARWESLDEDVENLNGKPLIPGMAHRVFELLSDDPSQQPVRDTLLQLAPGFIQIAAALMDEHFERQGAATPSERPAEGTSDASTRRGDEPANKPAVAAIGGNLNSCYMWREDGYVAKTWGAVRSDSNPT